MSITVNTNVVRTIDELHIIVLVAGTSDPINTSVSTKDYTKSAGRANSYSSKSFYWNESFFKGIMNFQNSTKENKAMIVFDKHGWSGDNSIKNREIAGSYLVNRLCGAEGLEAYYSKYKNSAVTLHLLGHSHGGNVINEMTKQMNKLGDKWPKQWKVKSLIYLSTPFFNELHQVKVTKETFHEDAEVLHLHCDFDLTQRMLANFSMEPLARLLISDEMSNLSEAIKKVQKFEFPKVSTKIEDVDDSWFGVDIELTMPYEEGKEFYFKFITLFEDIQEIFKALEILIRSLSKEKNFNVSSFIQKDLGEDILSYKRTIISEHTMDNMIQFIDDINNEVQKNIDSFKRRYEDHEHSKENYLLKNIFEDFEINELVKLILNFLDIDVKTLISSKEESLWNIVYKILDKNIEKYDNTYIKPDKQFKGTFLENKIKPVDVTNRDKYASKPEALNYYKFISYIEEIEKKYENDANQTNLLDLIFTLIVAELGESSYSYKGIKFGSALKGFANALKVNRWRNLNFKANEFEKRVFQLANLVQKFQEIFEKRDFGGLKDKSHKLTKEDKEKKVLQRGSIPYLLIEAHSTSRRILHIEVKDFLKKLGPKR